MLWPSSSSDRCYVEFIRGKRKWMCGEVLRVKQDRVLLRIKGTGEEITTSVNLLRRIMPYEYGEKG